MRVLEVKIMVAFLATRLVRFFLRNPLLQAFYLLFLRGLLRRFVPVGSLLPTAIVLLAVGGAAAGGPEAIRLFRTVTAGGGAIADIVLCAFLIFACAGLLLGITLLLARFLDAARTTAAEAPAPDPDTGA